MLLQIVTTAVLLTLCRCEIASTTNCVTPNGESAQCISLYDCNLYVSALQNADSETKRYLQLSHCGDYKVCCGSTTAFTTTTESSTSSGLRPYASRNICGYQHVDDRFYTKNETAIDEFPWIAQLRFKIHGQVRDVCVGSLISRRYILTAAHCVNEYNEELMYARLGEYDKTNDTDCTENPDFEECADPVQDVDFEKIIYHPDYKTSSRSFDIALIRLVRNVKFTEFIRPICLPSEGHKNATVGDSVLISGWGYKYSIGEASRVKKRSSNTIISTEQCTQQYRNSTRHVIDDSVICLQGKTENVVCNGDSGGPVMFQDGLQWQQEGIVSFGIGCGRSGSFVSASGNSKVAKYMDWIRDTIKP